MTLLQALKELLTTQKAMAMHLVRLDDRLDSTRADIILTVEQTYARVIREEMGQKVMCSNNKISHPTVMAMKGTDRASEVSLSLKSETKQAKEVEGGCSHCCNPRHTKKTCFKLHGYPDWWHKLNEKMAAVNKKGQGGQAHLAGCSDHALGHTDRSLGYTILAPHVKGTDRSAEKDNALVT